MSYGRIRKLLCNEYNEFNDTVLVESPFAETNRQGRFLKDVYLGLTPSSFVVAAEGNYNAEKLEDICEENETLEIISLYPVQYIDLTVFKNTKRQTLKAHLKNNVKRYFELGYFRKRKIFWKIWCTHVLELKSGCRTWPFNHYTCGILQTSQPFWNKIDCLEIRKWNELHDQVEKSRLKWTDKYVYLGDERYKEDKNRPLPIPGLGPTEKIKMQYLKADPLLDPVENFVECYRLEREETIWDFDAYTYTGEPTSNVTYTSIMNTIGCVAVRIFHAHYNIVQKLRCPPETSVFTGECLAILEAVKAWRQDLTGKNDMP